MLLDSAPILGMTDTPVLASGSDAVVMVIKTGAATRKVLKMAISQLEQVGVQIRGVVLNDVDVRRDRYYDYYYYYYYSPYGDDEERHSKRRKRRKHSRGQETTDESQKQSTTSQ